MLKIKKIICIALVVCFFAACSESDYAAAPADTTPSDLPEPTPFVGDEDVPQSMATDTASEMPEQAKPSEKREPVNFKIRPADEFKTVEWIELMPEDDLEALLNPPDYITDVEDGSFEDQISSQIRMAITNANDDDYQQALVSTRIIEEMDGKAIRLAGFIVPLEFDDELTITQFFLVPFFGACIHVPPPPPNQIILVNAPQGIEVEVLYDPFWISGVLTTTLSENEMATSAYSMDMHHFELYTE